MAVRARSVTVAGVDGWKQGWIAIVLQGGRFARAEVAADMAALLPRLADATTIAVDMPIGLGDGERACDAAARARLARRGSTLFGIPPRAVLEAATFEDASALARRLLGKGISQQAYALRTRILELDRHAADPRLHEVHPELSFLAMNDEGPLPPKKTWAGHRARLALLVAAGIELPDDLGAAGAAAPDDVLDAAAAAWSAARIARGAARRHPDGTERLPAIWA